MMQVTVPGPGAERRRASAGHWLAHVTGITATRPGHKSSVQAYVSHAPIINFPSACQAFRPVPKKVQTGTWPIPPFYIRGGTPPFSQKFLSALLFLNCCNCYFASISNIYLLRSPSLGIPLSFCHGFHFQFIRNAFFKGDCCHKLVIIIAYLKATCDSMLFLLYSP